MGVPRSVLLGEQPGTGFVWLPEDLEAVLGWLQHDEMTCKGCGHDVAVSFLPEMEGQFEASPLVCHACAAIETEREKQDKQPGLKVSARMSDEAQRWLKEQRG